MKVEGPCLDPTGWLEVGLLEVVGGKKTALCEEVEFKIRLQERRRGGGAKKEGFASEADLHEFQICSRRIKL
jgi:hypothetical protein